MTTAGWAIMIVSVGAVCALTIFCFVKLFTLPAENVTEHLRSPLDIDTRDTYDAD